MHPSPLRRGARVKLAEMDRALDRAYGTPEAILGNQDDPLDEAIYIILSFQTDLSRFSATWAKLRSKFRRWEEVQRASVQRVAQVLREGGLHVQKARTIKRLLASVRRATGELSLDAVRDMSDEDACRFLTRLPGISWKAARCIMLYSFNRDVFPVDVNTFRILKRTGVLPPTSVYRRRGLHDNLQRAVESSRRKTFHINLVVHGQRTCLPRRPRCPDCAIRHICAMCGVPRDIRTKAQQRSATRQQVASQRAHSQEGGRR